MPTRSSRLIPQVERGMHHKHQVIEEPCEGKLSRTVLEPRQGGDSLSLGSGMVKNRKLSRVISQQGWREFRVLVEAKSEKYGRKFVAISRWEPTSQTCSDCGYRWGKVDLSVRSILCLGCGSEHDRDENASANIEKVGTGHRHDSKCTSRDRKTTSVARPNEA